MNIIQIKTGTVNKYKSLVERYIYIEYLMHIQYNILYTFDKCAIFFIEYLNSNAI